MYNTIANKHTRVTPTGFPAEIQSAVQLCLSLSRVFPVVVVDKTLPHHLGDPLESPQRSWLARVWK